MEAVRAFDGYVEGGKFHPAGTSIQLPGRFRAVLTVIMDAPQNFEDKDTSAHWADELDRMVKECTSPPLNMEDFPRMDFGREPLSFANEGENV